LQCRVRPHGRLRVVDYGLADLDPGEQARMVYLDFQVCLTWPERYDPPPAALGDTPTIGIEDSSSVRLYWDGAAFQAYRRGD